MRFRYYVKINRVKDGDSFNVDLDKGGKETHRDMNLRLANCDTPETKRVLINKAMENEFGISQLQLKAFGLFVTRKVRSMLKEGEDYAVESLAFEQDSFSRYLVDFNSIALGGYLTDWLVERRWAIRYHDLEGNPKPKEARTIEHLQNLRDLIDLGVLTMTATLVEEKQ